MWSLERMVLISYMSLGLNLESVSAMWATRSPEQDANVLKSQYVGLGKTRATHFTSVALRLYHSELANRRCERLESNIERQL